MGKCSSCTLYVSVSGTRIVTSQTSDSRDSFAPVNAIDFPPTAFITSAAATQFALLPLVESAISTSSGFASPSTCCAKAVSHVTSLAKAVRIPLIETSEIAGSEPSSFAASSGGSFAATSAGMSRCFLNFFSSSPHICSASAALPPFPQTSTLPPVRYAASSILPAALTDSAQHASAGYRDVNSSNICCMLKIIHYKWQKSELVNTSFLYHEEILPSENSKRHPCGVAGSSVASPP